MSYIYMLRNHTIVDNKLVINKLDLFNKKITNVGTMSLKGLAFYLVLYNFWYVLSVE